MGELFKVLGGPKSAIAIGEKHLKGGIYNSDRVAFSLGLLKKHPEIVFLGKKNKVSKPKKAEPLEEKVVEAPNEEKLGRVALKKLSFSELRDLGEKLGVKGRSKEGLIDDIMNAQGKVK